MSATPLDTAARLLACGLPRRTLIGLLARATLGGAAVLLTGQEAMAQPGCRREGHPCEGNQTCCPGLTCAESEQGSARRCTAVGESECEGTCPTTESGVIVVGTDIDIAAECLYSGELRRTKCTFAATAGDGNVSSLTVPKSGLCADVVGGDFEEVEFGASAQPTGTGLKSTRQEDGAAVVFIELDGEVTTAATATYWCETDHTGLVPVTGPGVRCEETLTSPANDNPDSTGAVVVYAYSCDVASVGVEIDWFDVCQVPATQATFQLERVDDENVVVNATQSADASGGYRFEALAPSIYRIEQTNGDWCHAESNSVNEQGNVVVIAAEVVTVWVFNCHGGS